MHIEDIILSRDRRGISSLRSHLPPNFCQQAADFILQKSGAAIIVTGFYINGRYETDGPPGAVALGKALKSLGYQVCLVTDHCADILEAITNDKDIRVVDFPIADHEESRRFAQRLLGEIKPGVVIAIERCGFTQGRQYLNMRGIDISQSTAKMDYLFFNHCGTLGIGDGGNEIGMGTLYEIIPQVATLVKEPCATSTNHLILASVSNWGAYGLIGYLSLLAKKNLLPTVEEEQEIIKKLVDLGGVDGISGHSEYSVDSFSLKENSQVLASIHQVLADAGIKEKFFL